ncbi:uncharacterized protein EI90DRAFT_379998 [Cantharellus anzutake]|uniref:uncharacterized protein n=1 Tax=Cantharellus anzutake TaxID=1750568 RepID=UPI0019048CD5|nr:uncharacterized protein EI90DRAFT_379998 [Cantharellus anzutake]KAF8334948.1 hypothetical protein EI90DRAFT_379998 [Cantharellus anzutake]
MRRNRNSHWHRASKPSNDPPQASIPGPSVPNSQIPPDPSLPLSSLITEMRIDSPRAMPPTHYIQNNSTSVRTHQEPADIGTSVPVGSASRSSGDLKKTIVASTKLLLQAAATALKFTPIKNLDQIPNTLLACISIYEDVKGNSEDLKQLCIVIQQTQASVLEPLQKWTGEVPPELDSLVKEIRVYASVRLSPLARTRSFSP